MRRLAILLFGLGFSLPLEAGETRLKVDAEILLLADVSSSKTPHELKIQQRGYAAALTSAPVLKSIQRGRLARIAVSYVEWAGVGQHRVVVGWRLLDSPASIAAFADDLTASYDSRFIRTSISGALRFAVASIATNRFDGERLIIDISGDGRNNQGLPVELVRDLAVAHGFTINGLPLLVHAPTEPDLPPVDAYYHDCVIGGPGAFLIAVHRWEDFTRSVQRKLVLEIAMPQPGWPPLRPARYTAVDCELGQGDGHRPTP